MADVTESASSSTSAAMTALNKGLGGASSAAGGGLGWNLLREEVSLPAAVLYEDRVAHNLNWMRQFMEAYSVALAPHGKTTMAPKLFGRQLAGGAWGITLATAPQTRAAYHHGVRRVLMANQLVGRFNFEIISELLRDPEFEFFCLIDHPDNVDQLGRFFGERSQTLRVLVELGVAGGRAGVRDDNQLEEVLGALKRWPEALHLAGVEVYEGVLKEERDVREYLRNAVALTQSLIEVGSFALNPPLLTGAGSAWYDVVAEEFARAKDERHPPEIVLRPGCYLTHDVGSYEAAQGEIRERNPVARRMREGLRPALHVWAYVQSVPEKNLAIVGMGKRDAAFDAGLPRPALYFRPGREAPANSPPHWTLTHMMDQHAYLRFDAADDVKVGDMIGFDICHPCLTFDKWRHLLLVDADYEVIDVIHTFF